MSLQRKAAVSTPTTEASTSRVLPRSPFVSPAAMSLARSAPSRGRGVRTLRYLHITFHVQIDCTSYSSKSRRINSSLFFLSKCYFAFFPSERGPKNWEFMIRLLVDKKYNPELIRWEDQTEKTFRLVKPVVIAQMWGQRANKPNLSYDNFARGLR